MTQNFKNNKVCSSGKRFFLKNAVLGVFGVSRPFAEIGFTTLRYFVGHKIGQKMLERNIKDFFQ